MCWLVCWISWAKMCLTMPLFSAQDKQYQRLVFRISSIRTDRSVRVFKSLVTDNRKVYVDANNDLVRSLVRFNQSLQDAGLLSVLILLNNQEGTPFSNRWLTTSAEKRRQVLKWLSPDPFSDTYSTFQANRAKNSGTWFLNSREFQNWVDVPNLFILTGIGTCSPAIYLLTLIWSRRWKVTLDARFHP